MSETEFENESNVAVIEPPADKPYGERNAWVNDPFGNHWFIATPKE